MAGKIETLKKITEELFEHLGVKAKIQIKKEKDGTIAVQLTSDEPGILIGYHGQTLAAIQLIISLMVFKQFGQWTRVLVNVGDYRERREESLGRLAQAAAQRAKLSGQTQSLPPMSSTERRIIHLALAEDPDVETVSEGEGQSRHILVKPRASK